MGKQGKKVKNEDAKELKVGNITDKSSLVEPLKKNAKFKLNKKSDSKSKTEMLKVKTVKNEDGKEEKNEIEESSKPNVTSEGKKNNKSETDKILKSEGQIKKDSAKKKIDQKNAKQEVSKKKKKEVVKDEKKKASKLKAQQTAKKGKGDLKTIQKI